MTTENKSNDTAATSGVDRSALFDRLFELKLNADFRRARVDWSGWIDFPDRSGWWLVVLDWERDSEILEIDDSKTVTSDCYWEDCQAVPRGKGDGVTISGRWLFLSNTEISGCEPTDNDKH
jgi:hypothetical protein